MASNHVASGENPIIRVTSPRYGSVSTMHKSQLKHRSTITASINKGEVH